MNDEDLVDVEKVCKGVLIDVIYAREDNVFKKIFYPAAKCYLRRKVAHKLLSVHQELEKLGLGLKIFDGYRPLSVQKLFWDFCPDPRYVGDPSIGSKHNRGAAVDVTLVDIHGKELQMPTAIDDFTEKAHRDYDELPQKVIANRQLLEDVMVSKGFIPLSTEWWHFDDSEWEKYPLEDIDLENLVSLDNAKSV